MEALLKVENLKKYFPVSTSWWKKSQTLKAVDGVSLEVFPGETLGLVGESGCGKSTLGRTLIRLYEPTEGKIKFQGKDFLSLQGKKLREARRQFQMIFQDPFSSLDPKMTVGQLIGQPFVIHKVLSGKALEDQVKKLLISVGLKASHINRYPHEFSGGQRQRICIARAMALNPQLILADEPVSALDVSIQAQILNLLKELQEQRNLTLIFISHDLSVIEHMCDRIAVMYLGKIVELADREELFRNPQHPYTKALIASIPRVGQGPRKIHRGLTGEVPSPLNPPTGCSFHPRCPQATEQCQQRIPQLRSFSPQHQVACDLVLTTNNDRSSGGIS